MVYNVLPIITISSKGDESCSGKGGSIFLLFEWNSGCLSTGNFLKHVKGKSQTKSVKNLSCSFDIFEKYQGVLMYFRLVHKEEQKCYTILILSIPHSNWI